MKSTPLELSSSVSHNSHTEFISEVILMTSFSKNTSVTNIFKRKNARKLEKKLFFIYLQSTSNRYILLRSNLNFFIFYFFHAHIRLFAANMFLLCNTCHFITANTFGYKKSVRRIIAKGWTWRCYRGIILRIYMIF